MLKVAGKIFIFLFGVCLLVAGISELIYLIIQYCLIFDAFHIAFASIQGVLALSTGVAAIVLISKNKNTFWLSVPCTILFCGAIYCLVIAQTSGTAAYYLTFGIVNLISAFLIIVSLFWNRKK